MYVTDRLYLSVRSAPDPELPSQAVISSDTEVEVLERSDEWARIMLADGQTGWVMEKYLVHEVPRSQKIEVLEQEIETKSQTIEDLNTRIKKMSLQIEELTEKTKNQAPIRRESGEQTDTVHLVKRLQAENASLKEDIAELQAVKASEPAMKRQIEDLKQKLAEAATRDTGKSMTIVYLAGAVVFVIGLILGYLVKRPKKNRYYLR
jgi:SH3 domain protein